MYFDDELDDVLADKLYALKSAGFFYHENDKMIDILKRVSDNPMDSHEPLEQLLFIFFNQPNDIDTIRLHLVFRKSGNSHRYRMKRKLYDNFIEDRDYALSHSEELKKLL